MNLSLIYYFGEEKMYVGGVEGFMFHNYLLYLYLAADPYLIKSADSTRLS